jgi:hypothetical protein
LREVDRYTEAYLYYLCTTYLPLALDRDSTFGLRRVELGDALNARGDVCEDATVRKVCLSLAGKIKETA